MENFESKIAEINQEASRLYALKLSEDLLFEALNKVPNGKLDELQKVYSNSEGKPVNSLRERVLDLLHNNERVSRKTLDQMIEEATSSAEKNSFKAWGYFSILFPIISKDISFNVKNMLRDFGEELISKLNLSEVVARPVAVDFSGPRNFGADHVWMAIYNKSNPKQTTAVQLFLQVDYRGLICHLYDRLKDNFISSRKIEASGDMERQVFNFFNAVKDKVIQDQNPDEKDRFRELGIKGHSIFKISHNPEDFPTLEELQYCIDQSIVAVKEESTLNIDGFTDLDRFALAKPGDLFYLCWGSSRLLLIGQFEDDLIEDYEYNDKKGWKKRKYRFLFDAISNNFSTEAFGTSLLWLPESRSTCFEIPLADQQLANNYLFKTNFKTELKSSFSTELLPKKLGASARQKISIDEIVEPKLEVSLVARELSGIIDNLDENKGQMIGIFGSWGRGKTFLYDRMRNYLMDNKELRYDYEHYTFNAWKYQETTTVWAHLYDSLLEGYMGKSKWWGRFRKTIRLNFARKGWWPLLMSFGSLMLTISLTYFLSTSVKLEIVQWLIKVLGGIVGLAQAVYIYWRFYQPIKSTLFEYVAQHNYQEVLGFQSKIQRELKALISVWLKKSEDGKIRKRLLLFVDDIDRCQEEKIISVLDALRVMLDDTELVERIIVLVAVDEKLLNRAIHFKYRNFELSNGPYAKNLVEEYMDKLFIAGIKLPKLNEDEQGVILRNYAINNAILERAKTSAPAEEVKTEGAADVSEEPLEELVFPEANPREYIEAQSEYFLLEKEMELLTKYSNSLSESVTPRQLRIYMYRYLLAKNIASDYLAQKTGESQLSDEYCDFLARAIAYGSNATMNIEYKTKEAKLDEIKHPVLRAFSKKLVEMVVPY